MSRKEALEENTSSEVDLSETFFSQAFKVDEGFKPSEGSLFKESLIKEQHKDPEISCLFQKAVDESEMSKNPVCYLVENDVLMRKWRPLDVPAEDKWTVKYQVVIPKAYRAEILSTAHKTPLAGHLGVNKTYQKILNHFYWPNLKKDVAEFCRSCHTCQVVGKPNQAIPKAPLQPVVLPRRRAGGHLKSLFSPWTFLVMLECFSQYNSQRITGLIVDLY